MELYRDDEVSFWKIEASEEELALKPDYIEALPRYLNGLDSIFAKAQQQDEAQLILSLLGVRGMQSEGWDPYDTTVDAIAAATSLHNETEDRLAARHLSLWIYGHIVEAAAPYDLLANLIHVAQGGQAHGYHDAMIGLRRFYRGLYTEPKRVPAGPIAPGEELTIIVREGEGAVGIKDALTPAERAAGGIRFRYARLFPDEIGLLENDPDLATLPARQTRAKSN